MSQRIKNMLLTTSIRILKKHRKLKGLAKKNRKKGRRKVFLTRR